MPIEEQQSAYFQALHATEPQGFRFFHAVNSPLERLIFRAHFSSGFFAHFHAIKL
jgi:hypothetical protein